MHLASHAKIFYSIFSEFLYFASGHSVHIESFVQILKNFKENKDSRHVLCMAAAFSYRLRKMDLSFIYFRKLIKIYNVTEHMLEYSSALCENESYFKAIHVLKKIIKNKWPECSGLCIYVF